MSYPGGIWARIRLARAFEDLERELDQEFQDHFERVVRDALDAGATEAEAVARGREALGRISDSRSTIRAEDARRVRAAWWSGMLSYVGLPVQEALRDLTRKPGTHVRRVALLAAGLIAFGAVWTSSGPVRRPAPESSSDLWRVSFRMTGPDGWRSPSSTWGEFQGMRALPGFASLAALDHEAAPMVLEVEGRTERVRVRFATTNYFDLLGVEAVEGRLLTGADTLASTPPVVLSAGARERLGPAVQIGAQARLGGQNVTLLGVTPRGFIGADPQPFDIIVPLEAAVALSQSGSDGGGAPWSVWVYPDIWIRPADLAAVDLNDLAGHSQAAPDERVEVSARPWYGGWGSRSRLHASGSTTVILLGFMMLAVALLNTWVLDLAYRVRNRTDAVVSSALGASPGQLLAKAGVQAGLVGALAGAMAYGPARVGSEWVRVTTLSRAISPEALRSGWPLFVTLVLVGAAAAVSAAVVAQVQVPARGRPTKRVRAPTFLRNERWLAAGIAGQVVVLVVVGLTAALAGDAALRVNRIDVGADTDDVYRGQLVTASGAPAPQDRIVGLLGSLQSDSRVVSAAWSYGRPFQAFHPRDFEMAEGESRQLNYDVVSAEYFDLMGMDLIWGRIPAYDHGEVVVNGAARELLESRAGGQACLEDAFWAGAGCHAIAGEVSGRVEQVGGATLRIVPRVYFVRETPGPEAGLLVRLAPGLGVGDLDAAVAHVLGAEGGDILAAGWTPLREHSHGLGRLATLVAGLSFMSLVLILLVVASGLANVVSLLTARRASEFALRLALGAAPTDVAKAVAGRVILWLMGGTLVALTSAPVLRPILEWLPMDLDGRGIGVVGGLLVVVLTIVLGAAATPVWQAAAISPSVLLKRPE